MYLTEFASAVSEGGLLLDKGDGPVAERYFAHARLARRTTRVGVVSGKIIFTTSAI